MAVKELGLMGSASRLGSSGVAETNEGSCIVLKLNLIRYFSTNLSICKAVSAVVLTFRCSLSKPDLAKAAFRCVILVAIPTLSSSMRRAASLLAVMFRLPLGLFRGEECPPVTNFIFPLCLVLISTIFRHNKKFS